MPTIKLTQAAVDRLKPPTDKAVVYWDNQLPGFGLRIAPQRRPNKPARRTWLAMYRVSGKAVMETLGTMAEMPSVAAARERARASMTQAREGVHPVAKKRAEEQRAAETAAAEAARGITFREVAERFLKEGWRRSKKKKPWSANYAAEVRRILEHDVLPYWGAKPARAIVKDDVNELLDAKAGRRERRRKGTQGGAGVQANRVLTRLRTLFAWALAEDLIDSDPSARVLARGEETSRDRWLSDDEVRWFWAGCNAAGWPFGPLFKLLLLTAQRRDEVGGMRWIELDLKKRIWTIPRERAKSDRSHLVHLSAPAIDIIAAFPRTGDLVFSTTGERPVSGFSRAKERLDQYMETSNPEAEIKPWVLHDLRRTAATGMADLNIAPHVVDKILNHASGTIQGVAAIYNRHTYLEERKAALEIWAAHVASLVSLPTGAEPASAPSANVVEFPQRIVL